MAYGYHWRTVTLPALRIRAAYQCERCGMPERPMGLYRSHEGAHLDGDNANDADDNLAYLCRKCHRAIDYQQWAVKFAVWIRRQKQERIVRKDRERPISRYLELLDTGLSEVQAWGQMFEELPEA